eukprot:COSAG06_NODE_1083_length_10780_cov_2.547608_5_plen_113_part_00
MKCEIVRNRELTHRWQRLVVAVIYTAAYFVQKGMSGIVLQEIQLLSQISLIGGSALARASLCDGCVNGAAVPRGRAPPLTTHSACSISAYGPLRYTPSPSLHSSSSFLSSST